MSIMSWLPDSDPAIRWQIMRNLSNRSDEAVAAEQIRNAIDLVREHITWWQLDGRTYFDGETEPRINGAILADGAYFGDASDCLVDRLLDEQLDDDGWNCAGVEPDERITEAVDFVVTRRHQNGSWPLNVLHPDRVSVDMAPGVGKPNRWNTLRALRVLKWHGK